MKVSTIIVATLASVAAASSGKPPKGCTPGTYACTGDAKGWMVCNTSRQFVFAGVCPPETVCKFFQPSLSPYCVPPNFQFP